LGYKVHRDGLYLIETLSTDTVLCLQQCTINFEWIFSSVQVMIYMQ